MNAFHHLILRDNIEILDRIWKWATEQMTPEELNKLILAQDIRRRTAWHLAAKWWRVKTFDKLWEWVKEVLNRRGE